MNNYLLALAEENDVKVAEMSFKSNARGLCRGNKIAINKKIETQAEKSCVLAEELGHYFTTFGDIVNQDGISSVKQEIKAREWAYKKLITVDDLASAFNLGVRNRFELAEVLNVTEEFLEEAIQFFKAKYGMYYESDAYMIYFEPCFAFVRKIK